MTTMQILMDSIALGIVLSVAGFSYCVVTLLGAVIKEYRRRAA